MKNRNEQRLKRKLRIRAKVSGTKSVPRVAIFRSNKALYAQLINDEDGTTIAEGRVSGATVKNARELGADIAAKAKKKHIQSVVFDRGGYLYHGAIKAVADGIREGGVTI